MDALLSASPANSGCTCRDDCLIHGVLVPPDDSLFRNGNECSFAINCLHRATNAPVAHNQAPPKIVPINSLNSYQSRWTIKARVTQKAPKRTWSNARGEGRVFSERTSLLYHRFA